MIVTICNGCGDVVSGQKEFARVNFGPERLDLCRAKCLRHHEWMEQQMDLLAKDLERSAREGRAKILEQFKERLGGSLVPQIDLRSLNATPAQTENRP